MNNTNSQIKDIVLDFFDLAFVQGKVQEAADKYIGDPYIQHSPQAPDGAESFVQAINAFRAQAPELRSEVKRTAVSGDTVWIHHHLQASPDDRGTAVVDIFRVEDGKIVEHWDVLQPVPEESANTNGMF